MGLTMDAQQTKAMRAELARRIRSARAVSVVNDPARTYRSNANLCRKGVLSYNGLFGLAKVSKA